MRSHGAQRNKDQREKVNDRIALRHDSSPTQGSFESCAALAVSAGPAQYLVPPCSERIQLMRFFVCSRSCVLSFLCSSLWPSLIFTILPLVTCLISLSSACSSSRYLAATSRNAGPSFFFSIAWHLLQPLLRDGISAALTLS